MINKCYSSNKNQKTADIYNNIGNEWLNLYNHKKAVNCFNKALSIDRNISGEKNPKIVVY